jgi:hypothetical protein
MASLKRVQLTFRCIWVLELLRHIHRQQLLLHLFNLLFLEGMLGHLLEVHDVHQRVLSVHLVEFLEWILRALLPRGPLVLVRVVTESPILSNLLNSGLLMATDKLGMSSVPLAAVE